LTSAPGTKQSACGAARRALSASLLRLSIHDAPKPRPAKRRTQPTNSVGIAKLAFEPLAKPGLPSAPSTPPSASGAARHALSASVLHLSIHDAPKPRLAMFRTQPTNSVGIAKLAFCNWLVLQLALISAWRQRGPKRRRAPGAPCPPCFFRCFRVAA
jgi:hypothetical protein